MSADIHSEEGYFAIVPKYVLDADITPQAIRLYAVLRRYADHQTLRCYPSRATLARRLHVCSTKVVDKASKELVGIGVLESIPRWIDSSGPKGTGNAVYQNAPGRHRTSNEYRIIRHPEVGKGERNDTGGRGAEDSGVGNEMTQEQEPLNPEPDELDERVAASVTRLSVNRRSKSSWVPKEPDDETSVRHDDEPRPLGATHASTTETKATKMGRGTSGHGLALRLEAGMASSGRPVNVSAVARGLNRYHDLPNGQSRELQGEMVRLFIEHTSWYHQSDATPVWKSFLAHLPKIAHDAANTLASGGAMTYEEKNAADAAEAQEIVARIMARKQQRQEVSA